VEKITMIPKETLVIEDDPFANGSFGAVYKGHLQVAAKSFHPLMNPKLYSCPINSPAYNQVMNDLQREARILQSMRHPHLLEFFGMVLENDRPKFLVTELAQRSLRDLMNSHPNGMDLRKTSHIAVQMAKGLEYLHSNQVFHRDLKPENILIFPGDLVKIADFGGSKRMDRASSNTLFGTPLYCAPEIQFGRYTLNVDIYSFGLIVIEMLMGKLPVPFEGPSRFQAVLVSGGIPIFPELDHRFPSVAPRLLQCFSRNSDFSASSRPSCPDLVWTRILILMRCFAFQVKLSFIH
jgi:serine/threonine protein kinase